MKLILAFLSLSVCAFAWDFPERCSQRPRSKRSAPTTTKAQVVPDIQQTVDDQKQFLQQEYENVTFIGMPVGKLEFVREDGDEDPDPSVYAPFNCSFYTHKPRLVSSVICNENISCKLSHTVRARDIYYSSSGYYWGTKASAHFSLEGIFEVGGKTSMNKSLECSHTRDMSITDTVECEMQNVAGTLQLYYIHSDLECSFGRIPLKPDSRDFYTYGQIKKKTFTSSEVEEIYNSALISYRYLSVRWIYDVNRFIVDASKISQRLYNKLIQDVPRFNIYTDFLSVYVNRMTDPVEMSFDGVFYKVPEFPEEDYKAIVPFTNEHGDSIYQYSCVLTP